jgi:hypothetical protein
MKRGCQLEPLRQRLPQALQAWATQQRDCLVPSSRIVYMILENPGAVQGLRILPIKPSQIWMATTETPTPNMGGCEITDSGVLTRRGFATS